MSQPNTAANNNNLRNGMIFMLLLTLVVVVCYYFFSKEREEKIKHPTNPTTAAIREDKETEAGKKGGEIETSGKGTAVQREASTSYLSLWGLLGGVGVTTFALACYKELSFNPATWGGLQTVFETIFSNRGKPIIAKALWVMFTLALPVEFMGIEDNILAEIWSGQNLLLRPHFIIFSFATAAPLFCKQKLSASPKEAPVEALIAVILTWLVHDGIAYLLSDRVAKPSAKLAPKLA